MPGIFLCFGRFGKTMRKKTPSSRPKARLAPSANHTDLRAPGQSVIISGRPDNFHNLMVEQPLAGILPLPSDDDWTGRVPNNENPTPLSILGERVGRGAREARRLIQRIGRPRQP